MEQSIVPTRHRQVLAAGLNLHLDHLSVTVPVDEERVESTLTSVLRRDASAVSVLDYGFDPSLGVIEAQRTPLREPERGHRPERGHKQGLQAEATSINSPQADAARNLAEIETAAGNRNYLLDNPDHVLVLLQSDRSVFTEGDIREALRSRLSQTPGRNVDTAVATSTDPMAAAKPPDVGTDPMAADGFAALPGTAALRLPAAKPPDVGADPSVGTDPIAAGDLPEAQDVRADIEEAFARVMASGLLVELNQPAPDGKLQYVTKVRAQEMQRLDRCAGDMATSHVDVPDAGWREINGDRLSGDQLAAAQAMLSDTGLTLVKGYAGTGKTFTLGQVAKEWQARGYEVLVGAPSARATQALTGIEGVRTGTLAAWEARWSRDDLPKVGAPTAVDTYTPVGAPTPVPTLGSAEASTPDRKFVFIMDEAGMVGAGQWSRIGSRVHAMGGKLIAVGDPEQLQPVKDLPGWAVAEQAIERLGQSISVMGEVRRQRKEGDRAATMALARGGSGIEDAIRHYISSGSLRLAPSVVADPVGAIADYYYGEDLDPDPGVGTDPSTGTDPTVGTEPNPGSGGSRIALAYTNREVRELNGAIRARALELGVVDSSGVRSYGMIERQDAMSGDAPRRFEVPLELGPGDRVMLTRPHRDLELPRSSFGTVVATRDDEIDLAVDGRSKPVTIDLAEFRDLDYGYAATIHKSQGLTVDHAIVLGHGRMHRHAVYVALSRHRESVTVFGQNRHLISNDDLIRLAQKPGHLSVAMEEAPDTPPVSMVAGAEVVGVAERGDWLGSGVEHNEVVGSNPTAGTVTFAADGHLMAVAERVSGLLAARLCRRRSGRSPRWGSQG